MVPSLNLADAVLPVSSNELINSLDVHDMDNVVSWINHTLLGNVPDDASASTSHLDLIDLDQQVAHLVAVLEIASQDTAQHLERTVDDVSRGVPRLGYDLHFMKDGVLALQSALSNVQTMQRNSVPGEMNAALDRLQYLDTVKRSMEAARDVLREAESWSTLESEVTSLLAEQNYEKAAERLSEASKSMVVFENTPEYDARRALMVSLQNQLEASLSSALVAAITTQDVTVCKHFFAIFANIQRESEFRNYYNGARRGSVVEMWANAHLVDCDAGASSDGQRFAAFLHPFYAHFLSVLNAERTSIAVIFPDPQRTLSTLVSSALSTLQPTFSQRLASLFNHHGSAALKELIAALRATEEFAVSVDNIMQKAKLSASVPSAEPKLLGRRRSARMSISWRTGRSSGSISTPDKSVSLDPDLEWDQDLFHPFLDFQVDYPALELHLLSDLLRDISSADSKGASVDRARLLREKSVDVFSAAEEALGRCTAFTHGYGSVGVVNAVDQLLRMFLDEWTTGITAEHPSSSALADPSSGEDLSDLDYSQKDWSRIQSYLHLLAAARAFFDRLCTFEAKLRAHLAQTATTFNAARHEDLGVYLPGLTRGQAQLLAQSTLNSAELHNLLKTVDSEHNSLPHPTLSPPTPGTRHNYFLLQAKSSDSLLSAAHAALSTFARTCQSSLQDTILAPLRKHLESYASMPVWNTQGDSRTKRGAGSANDLHVPVFSLSPTDVVQRVAEGLLNLPRLFEVYADDDALSFSLDTLPYVDVESLKALSEQTNDPPHGHIRRQSISSRAVAHFTPEAVSSAWLSSLGHSVLSRITTDDLPKIRTLTSGGAAQLASDLAYLSNIVRALNVEFEDIERWKALAELSDEDGRKRVVEKGADDSVLRCVAKMRGWSS
ncbi:hypothetical protein PLICRDRAFT_47054 [Plicaturopsis crispa FD-325 SS-3]|uniref:Conserved oligomeric Golgi complex subunit 7 n=1 Tax=Plicaturopsis crispa FD-325 SS-3 TaxID=944288 RepID=A0A0C9T3I0_PLICR|nr:hypothetical protein PLICRDRAFT_47054 [Plicaturopsis crispa FD-325 SS-3]